MVIKISGSKHNNLPSFATKTRKKSLLRTLKQNNRHHKDVSKIAFQLAPITASGENYSAQSEIDVVPRFVPNRRWHAENRRNFDEFVQNCTAKMERRTNQ